MRTRIRVITFVLSLTLLTGLPALHASYDPYAVMMEAIESWLETKSSRMFESTNDAEIFFWKVAIEESGSDNEIRVYKDILSEIGDREFVYSHKVFNELSLWSFILHDYPTQRNQKQISDPIALFDQAYNRYTTHVRSNNEQMHWLVGFLRMFSRLEARDAYELMEVRGEQVEDLILQHLALSGAYLKGDRDINNVMRVYSTAGGFLTFGDAAENHTLIALQRVLEADMGELISDELSKSILDFVIPDYAERDSAVKIYSILR